LTKRTLLVGLDAACWEYLDPLLRTGQLPHLAELVARGTSGTLRSTMPALTPVAWASLITGKNPGKHGVFDMVCRPPGGYVQHPTSARVRQGTPFWQRLNDAGVRVGVVNVPFSHPPDRIDGFALCGFGTPASARDLTHPAEALEWIEAACGPYAPDVISTDPGNSTPQAILAQELQHQSSLVEIACRLVDRYPVEVLVINLMLLDHANHFIGDMALVERAMRDSYAHLGQLLRRLQPDNVMVLSDHGSRRLTGDFLLYAWLQDQGLVAHAPRSSRERGQALNWLLTTRAHTGETNSVERVRRRVLREMVMRIPEPLLQPFWHRVEATTPRAREYVQFGDALDYDRTRLFPGWQRSGLYHFNLVGREPSGVVDADGRSVILAELRRRLGGLADPRSGRPIFTGIHTPEQIYDGPLVPYAPDLILDDYDASCGTICTHYVTLKDRAYGQYFVENRQTFGWHARDGLFVFAGQDFRESRDRLHGHIMDIAPTLLYLHDTPIPEDYDGQVLLDTIRQDVQDGHEVRSQRGDGASIGAYEDALSHPVAESREVVERLRALGYVG